ncbi:hypothetical protein PANI_CDS0022 [Maribacter phage Panino]
MSKFKNGQRVKVLGSEGHSLKVGEVGTVVDLPMFGNAPSQLNGTFVLGEVIDEVKSELPKGVNQVHQLVPNEQLELIQDKEEKPVPFKKGDKVRVKDTKFANGVGQVGVTGIVLGVYGDEEYDKFGFADTFGQGVLIERTDGGDLWIQYPNLELVE